MTVAELIEKLKEYPQDYVVIESYHGRMYRETDLYVDNGQREVWL